MTVRLPAPPTKPLGHFSPGDGEALLSGSVEGCGTDPRLAEVLRAAKLGILEIWEDSLEIASFDTGSDEEQPFGLQLEQISEGAPWAENIYPSDRDALRVHLLHNAANSGTSVDYRIIVGEGELLWVRHWTLNRSAPENGRCRLRALLMPIPQQKHLEWECLRVSERECNRVGQELHDDLCQVLAGLTFMMRVVGQHARKVDLVLAAQIDEFNAHLVTATERVRSMAHGLFPAQLKYATLRHALTAFSAEARNLFQVEVNLSFPRRLPSHNPAMIVHVYRIVQEAVSNAVRHGHASTVQISVDNTPEGVSVRIQDDGKGLPVESCRPEGIGMHVMQYRAHALGGTITIENIQPHGAAATLVYPAALPQSDDNPTSPATL